MDKTLLRNFLILNEISNDRPITQREMAKHLGIAVGLANTYLKRLVRKGYIMVKTMPSNRITYNLTPQGISEKARLTYEYMKYSFQYYKDIRIKFRNVFLEIEKKRLKKIIFYGAGEVAEIAYISLNGLNLDLIYLVDDNKHGSFFFDKQVHENTKLCETKFDRVVVTAFASREIICGKLKEMDFPKEKILLIN